MADPDPALRCPATLEGKPFGWETCSLDASAFAPTTPIHPLLCGRLRPSRRPKYLPRPRHDAGRVPVELWGPATMTTAPDGGPVRIGMNWARSYDTSTTFCRESGTAEFFEGPHEQALFKRMTMDHRCVDMKFQPATLSWSGHPAGPRSYTLDAAELSADGWLTFHEVKAHPAYFEVPETADLLDAAEAFLTSFPNVRLNRECGNRPDEELRRRIANEAFYYRMFECTPMEIAAAVDVVHRSGGTASLASVRDAIDPDPLASMPKAYAMLAARHLAFDLALPPTDDTPVRLPEPVLHPTRLRDFLRLFAPGGSA